MLTANGEVRDVLEGSRKCHQDGDGQADQRVDDCTCGVARQNIHHDRKGRQMSRHDEDQDEELSETEQFPTDRSKQDHSSVSHARALWVLELELTDHVASVSCDQP